MIFVYQKFWCLALECRYPTQITNGKPDWPKTSAVENTNLSQFHLRVSCRHWLDSNVNSATSFIKVRHIFVHSSCRQYGTPSPICSYMVKSSPNGWFTFIPFPGHWTPPKAVFWSEIYCWGVSYLGGRIFAWQFFSWSCLDLKVSKTWRIPKNCHLSMFQLETWWTKSSKFWHHFQPNPLRPVGDQFSDCWGN